ncbi:hypothetical protein E2C01_014660 [Portunus trituberculatus]|uniref:Uncharacterized protein n=1 Tax=Portunus trituberculatus TaxID=210409 RepID=A0A5B7DKP2_PORTR|nr:hypothetical protein [Portunus trituberculatus]
MSATPTSSVSSSTSIIFLHCCRSSTSCLSSLLVSFLNSSYPLLSFGLPNTPTTTTCTFSLFISLTHSITFLTVCSGPSCLRPLPPPWSKSMPFCRPLIFSLAASTTSSTPFPLKLTSLLLSPLMALHLRTTNLVEPHLFHPKIFNRGQPHHTTPDHTTRHHSIPILHFSLIS